LSITDFTSATRLTQIQEKYAQRNHGKNYFKETPVEKILANLNNDLILDARDI
jgi:hypothetical protein